MRLEELAPGSNICPIPKSARQHIKAASLSLAAVDECGTGESMWKCAFGVCVGVYKVCMSKVCKQIKSFALISFTNYYQSGV